MARPGIGGQSHQDGVMSVEQAEVMHLDVQLRLQTCPRYVKHVQFRQREWRDVCKFPERWFRPVND